MKNYEILKIKDNKELIKQACEWFHQKWGIPKEDYMQSMEECIKSTSPFLSGILYWIKNYCRCWSN